MAAQRRSLRVIHSPTAGEELKEIWRWNAAHYDTVHANAYLQYVRQSIDDLSVNYAQGTVVSTRPDLRFILIRRRASGHGHIAVYKCIQGEVHILHVFHTAQDWPTRLIEENP